MSKAPYLVVRIGDNGESCHDIEDHHFNMLSLIGNQLGRA